jgi:hypothetical protein
MQAEETLTVRKVTDLITTKEDSRREEGETPSRGSDA